MSRPRLWVVDPSVSHPEDQGVREILDGWPGESRLFQPVLRPGDGPEPATGHSTDAVVLMGSAASVHDDAPWIGRLDDWLRPLLDGSRPIPVLGICFGHQLIAHVAGAEVGFVTADRAKVLGVEHTRLEGGRLLPGQHELRVVVSHREEVRAVPRGYLRSATRSTSAIDGIEHRELPVFAFQFHPEAREDFARTAGFDPSAIDPRLRADSRRVLEAFRRFAIGQKKGAGG